MARLQSDFYPENMDIYDPNTDFDNIFVSDSEFETFIGNEGLTTEVENLDKFKSVKQRVVETEIYKYAYKLFSSLADKTWLNLLQGIIDEIQDAPTGWYSGFTLSDEDKDFASYQAAIQKITQLVKDYQEYVNSLPYTQVQQYTAAGYNSAITGEGLSGSEISHEGQFTDPSQIRSVGAMDFIGSVANTLTTISGGALSWIESLRTLSLSSKQLSLSERVQNFAEKLGEDDKNLLYANFNQLATQLGLPTISRNSSNSVLDNFNDELGSSSVAKIVSTENLLNEASLPVLTQEYMDELGSLGEVRFNLFVDEYQLRKKQNDLQGIKSSYESALFGGDESKASEYGSLLRSHEESIKGYESSIANHKLQYLNEVYKRAKDGNNVCKYLIHKMLGDIDINSLVKMKSTGVLSDFIDSASEGGIPFGTAISPVGIGGALGKGLADLF